MNHRLPQIGLEGKKGQAQLEQMPLFPELFPDQPEDLKTALSNRLWEAHEQSYASNSSSKETRRAALWAMTLRPRKQFRTLLPGVPQNCLGWQALEPEFSVSGALPSVLPQLDDPYLGLRLALLLDRISWHIVVTFREPQLVKSTRLYVRVEFMGCIAWVVLARYRQIAIEVKDRNGQWQLTTVDFDVLRPFDTVRWIEQILLNWLPWLSMTSEADAEAGYEWLKDNLVRRFSDPAWIRKTQRQMRARLNLAPGLNRALIQISRYERSPVIGSAEYQKLWSEEPFWSELFTRHPRMIHFYFLAREELNLASEQDLGVLRSLCKAMGMGRAGWRFLCRHGPAAYKSVVRELGTDELLAYTSAIYIDWQSKAGLEKPLRHCLGKGVVSIAIEPVDTGGELGILIDSRIAKVADDHWCQLTSPTQRNSFVEDEWIRVLMWLRDHQPQFDRNQWRVGWSAIWRSYQNWLSLNWDQSNWESDLSEFSVDGWIVTPLTSAYDLALEGMRMRHCVADYAENCAEGNYRVFSVSCGESGQPVATVGLIKAESSWEVEQIKGKCNIDPGPELVEIGSLILRHQESSERTKRLQDLKAHAQTLRHVAMTDSIRQLIRNRCFELTNDLEQLRAVTIVGFDMTIAITRIVDALREFLVFRNDAFDEELIQRIRLLSDTSLSTESTIHPDHEFFVVGNCYLAGSNSYRVLESKPTLKIQQESAVASFSSDLVPGLWAQHAESLKKLTEKLLFYETTALSAEIEINNILHSAEADLRKAHEGFLDHQGLPIADIRRSSKRHRVTHCYSCKNSLDNDNDLECQACGWIVCRCGACGCGWDYS